MKRLITEETVITAHNGGKSEIAISKGDIVTPAAYDKIRELRMSIVEGGKIESKTAGKEWKPTRVIIGSDHTGFQAKKSLITYLENAGIEVLDAGTHSETSCDYPDIAVAVVDGIIRDNFCFGIILDATGVPSAITANRFPGIRAATCYNEFSAKSARAHNNANILVMGAKTLGDETLKSILQKFIDTPFEGERHQRRLNKITVIEEKLLRLKG